MKSENEWFIIDDLEKFIESTRVLVFSAFGEENEKSADELALFLSDLKDNEAKELEQTISQAECLSIAKNYLKKQYHKVSKKERYIISTDKYMEMMESINARMISNMLTHLASKGLIESAYDTEANDFIFWVKDDKEENQKPETD